MSFGALILRMRVNDTHLHQSLSQYGQLPKRPGGVLHRKDSVVNKVFQDLVFRGVGSGKLSDSYKVYKGDGNWLAGPNNTSGVGKSKCKSPVLGRTHTERRGDKEKWHGVT